MDLDDCAMLMNNRPSPFYYFTGSGFFMAKTRNISPVPSWLSLAPLPEGQLATRRQKRYQAFTAFCNALISCRLAINEPLFAGSGPGRDSLGHPNLTFVVMIDMSVISLDGCSDKRT